MKRCPHCARDANDAAHVCPSCGFMFAAPFSLLGMNSARNVAGRIVGVIGIVWLFYVLVSRAGSS